MGNRTCSLDGCDNKHQAKGFCSPHFNRWKRHGDPLAGRVLHAGKQCEVEDCHEPLAVRKWCTRHYNSWLRTGEPVRKRAGRTGPPPPGAEITRTCTKCDTVKPLEDFSPAKLGKYGRRSQCKVCLQAAALVRRESKRTRPPLWARRPVGTPGTAWCSKCKVFKESKFFHLDQRNSDGFKSQCRDCNKELAAHRDFSNNKYTLMWLNDPKAAAAYARRARLLRRYGITPEDYDRLLASQGGRCAICRSDDPRHGRKDPYFHIDHDHETKEVRGLLCSPCNTGLGGLGDSAHLLRIALEYLEKPPYQALVEGDSKTAAA